MFRFKILHLKAQFVSFLARLAGFIVSPIEASNDIVHQSPTDNSQKVVVYVDLDNLLGQFKKFEAELYSEVKQYLTEILERVAGIYDDFVEVRVYGYLDFHQVEALDSLLPNGEINFIDTPIVSDYESKNGTGKTKADMKIGIHAALHHQEMSRCVLVTCDVDFEELVTPVSQGHGVAFDLVQFGPTNKDLINAVDRVIDGIQILYDAPIDNTLLAKHIIMQALHCKQNQIALRSLRRRMQLWQQNHYQGFNTLRCFVSSLNIPRLTILPAHGGVVTLSN